MTQQTLTCTKKLQCETEKTRCCYITLNEFIPITSARLSPKRTSGFVRMRRKRQARDALARRYSRKCVALSGIAAAPSSRH